MVYCLINDSDLNKDSIKINYSVINDSEELKVTKTFDIDLNNNNVCYRTFAKDQIKKNILENYMDEITYDFGRCRFIFGKNEFKDYFYEIEDFNKFNENFEFKYMKISDLVFGVNRLRVNL